MKKAMFVLLFFAVQTFAISGFTYPWVLKANDTVTFTKWKANNDTVKSKVDQLCDTVNRAVVHFSPSSLNRNNVVQYVNIDTIRSAPDIDTIKGNTVFTGAVSVDSLKSTKGVTAPRGFLDSLKLGSGDWLKTCKTGTIPCTLKTSTVTTQQTGVIKYTIIGNLVTLAFPFIYSTSNSTSLELHCGGLTGDLNPGYKFGCSLSVIDNGVSVSGSANYLYGSGDYFIFKKYDNSSFTTSGNKGIGNWITATQSTITYTK